MTVFLVPSPEEVGRGSSDWEDILSSFSVTLGIFLISGQVKALM